MSEEKQTVDEAILAELKALREEVKLLREQAKLAIMVIPGTPYPVYIPQPYPVAAPMPWYQPIYGHGGSGIDPYQRGIFSAGIAGGSYADVVSKGYRYT